MTAERIICVVYACRIYACMDFARVSALTSPLCSAEENSEYVRQISVSTDFVHATRLLRVRKCAFGCFLNFIANKNDSCSAQRVDFHDHGISGYRSVTFIYVHSFWCSFLLPVFVHFYVFKPFCPVDFTNTIRVAQSVGDEE